MHPADEPHADALVQHGIDQQDVVRFKCDDRLEAGCLKQAVRQDADAVAGALQDKRGVPQILQADGILLGQRVGRRQRDQKLFVGDGDIRRPGAGRPRAQGKVDLPPGNGPGLLGGIQLGQAEGDIGIAAGKRAVDLAVYDRAAVGRGGQTDLAAAARDLFHGQQHPALLIQDTLGRVDHIPADRGGIKPPPITQKKGRAKIPLAFG